MKTKTMKEQKGITLIALVITIIVLLILAGVAISMLSGENGILKQAAKAKTDTEKESLEEGIQLAYLSALTAGHGKVNYGVLNSELAELGFDRGSDDDNDGVYSKDISQLPSTIEIDGKEYTLTKDGKSVEAGKWKYKENAGKKVIVTNGVIELRIGTYINYDAGDTTESSDKTSYTSPKGTYISSSQEYSTAIESPEQGNGFTSTSIDAKAYEGKWKVLGVNEETGEILIVSADTVGGLWLNGVTGAQYGVAELDNMCKTFGYGKGASTTTAARSIDVDDVNKITGYNPNNTGKYDPNQTGTGTKYQAGTINEYGNEVTYSWTATTNQVSGLGTNGKTYSGSNSNYETCGFSWFEKDENKWKTSNQTDYTIFPAKITTLTSSFYAYHSYSLTEDSKITGTQNGVSVDSPENKTIFYKDDGSTFYYWLATPYTSGTERRFIRSWRCKKRFWVCRDTIHSYFIWKKQPFLEGYPSCSFSKI